MKAKAQVTLFLLVGLAIVGIGILSLSQNNEQIDDSTQNSFLEVENFVQTCLDNVAKNAIKYIGEKGGFFELPEHATHGNVVKTAYYYSDGIGIIPSITTIESELNKYMDTMLFACLRGYQSLKEKGYAIAPSKAITSTSINFNSIDFNVYLPISVQRSDKSKTLGNFETSIIDINIHNVLEASKKIIAKQIELEHKFCLTCLSKVAQEHNLQVQVATLDESILISLFDSVTNPNQPYMHRFAMRIEE